jgi:hypothetical protein
MRRPVVQLVCTKVRGVPGAVCAIVPNARAARDVRTALRRRRQPAAWVQARVMPNPGGSRYGAAAYTIGGVPNAEPGETFRIVFERVPPVPYDRRFERPAPYVDALRFQVHRSSVADPAEGIVARRPDGGLEAWFSERAYASLNPFEALGLEFALAATDALA